MGNATSCPSPHNTQDLHHQGTSHKPLLILSTACTAITLCSAAALATLHLLNYRARKEQRQIVKILLAPFVFALVSLAQILAYPAAAYLDPISSAYEAVCLCALFLLYVQFAAGPGKGTFGEELFEAVRAAQETSAAAGDGDGDGDGRGRRGNWPKATWAAVFQYPVTELIAIVVLEVTEATGTYCSTSLRPRYGHFWASLIHSVGLVVAVVSLVRFYGRMKGRMRARRGLAKLGCFKAMVALRFLQTWIFNILIDQDVLQPSSIFSYGDLLYGLPNALLCVESVVFSAIFWYAFSATEYRNHPGARLGVWKAGLDAANPLDLLRGIARAVGLVASFSRRQDGEIAPMRRADRGKYRTLEGMESLERPGRSRSRTPLGEFEGRGGRDTEV